jgi:hypothetical protein
MLGRFQRRLIIDDKDINKVGGKERLVKGRFIALIRNTLNIVI